MIGKKEQIGMNKASEWLRDHGYTIVEGNRTYIGHDIVASKNGLEVNVEVKYRSYPNLSKQWVELTEAEINADLLLVVAYDRNKCLGVIAIDLRKKESYRVTETRKYRVHTKLIPKNPYSIE